MCVITIIIIIPSAAQTQSGFYSSKVMVGRMIFLSNWPFHKHHLPLDQEGAVLGNMSNELWDDLRTGHWCVLESAGHKICFKQSPLRAVRITWMGCFPTIYGEVGPWQKLHLFWSFYTKPPKFYDWNLIRQSHWYMRCQLSDHDNVFWQQHLSPVLRPLCIWCNGLCGIVFFLLLQVHFPKFHGLLE